MPTYALSGWQTLAQKKLTQTIASQGYARSALLFLLVGLAGGTPNMLAIGRPDEGEVFSGSKVTKAEKSILASRSSYAPRIQSAKLSNTTMMSPYGTMPSVANASTASQPKTIENTAQFLWTQYLETPIQVYDIDLEEACQGKVGDDFGVSSGYVMEQSVKQATEEHVDQLISRMLYGSPTNQFTNPNDDLQGVTVAGTASGVYGQVDRSGLTYADPWMPATYCSSAANTLATSAYGMDIYGLIQDMNITCKMGIFGQGVNVVLLNSSNYIIAKRQVEARGRGVILHEGLPNMAEMGVKRELLLVDNCYVALEPFLDTCYGTTTAGAALYTAQPTYAIGLNLKVWKLMFKPNYNMKVNPFTDITFTGIGNPKAKISAIESRAILACDRPSTGIALFTTVS